MKGSCTAIVAALPLAAVTPARALLDAGPEFQVNTYTTGPQRAPAVAVQGDGSFVVVWQSGEQYGYHDAPADSASGVFLQRFDATGAKMGSEQHVNTFTISEQRGPRVSASGDGSFVVVWESGCYSGGAECSPDGSNRAIAARRFDVAGVPQGGEFLVNTSTLGQQYSVGVGSVPTGEFVVTWASHELGYPMPGDDTRQVVARRFTAEGSPAGGELPVDMKLAGSQGEPAVAVGATGDFVVVWEDYDEASDPYLRIRGRRFEGDGTALGEIEVSGGAGYANGRPRVAAGPDGEFVVAWTAYYYADRVKRDDVHAQRFAADGTPLGPSFVVNSHLPGDQFAPDVAIDAAGHFIVAWTSQSYGGHHDQDGDLSGVFAQAFARDGGPLGGEIQVNTFTTGLQSQPAVGVDPTGEFVVTWASAPYYGGAAQDGDGAGVFARTLKLRACTAGGDCDDANPCTTDACEDGVCLNRRQPGCCQTSAECFDGDPCTDDVCAGTACTFPPISDCVRCSRVDDYCVPRNVCARGACRVDLGRCEYEWKPGCCLDAGDCDDGHACTVDACTADDTCVATPMPDCVECGGDAECSTGCLIAPETCVAGRCESPAGCPVVGIDDADPLGAAGKLLASVEIPADVPGKGKVKAAITARVGSLEAGDAPSRRCRTGKVVGHGRTVLMPGSTGNVLLALTKRGVRCLTADPDGALPIDVTVRVRRKKTPLSELTESRTWHR
jgi:hypothetical protein